MSAPPPLDFAALLAPIPGENPAGNGVPIAAQMQMVEARKEDNPADYSPEELSRQELRKADWPTIVRLAQQTLTTDSKDLLVAARLTEALVKLYGFGGLREGLHLLRNLVEQCWDRLNPPLEDGDMEARAAPFYWLDDADKGARFPNTLRMVPLVFSENGDYGWIDWHLSQKEKGSVNQEGFEKALLTTSPQRCAEVVSEINHAREELNKLIQSLSEKMGSAAPGLTAVQRAMEECGGLAREILKRKSPESDTKTHGTDGEPMEPGSGTADAARAPGSRAEAYRQLARAAAVLQNLEPHSPIPYLIQRAVELGSLPFPQLIKALIRDAGVLTELNRELGIKEPPAQE
jgi:type VI secretion system protein ImpA